MHNLVTDETTVKIFHKAKIPKGRLVFDADEVKILPAETIKVAYDWMYTMHNKVYLEALRAWKLVPESMWAYYERMEMVDMREQLILNVALSKLRDVVISSDKPKFFTKKGRDAIIKKAIKAIAEAKSKDS